MKNEHILILTAALLSLASQAEASDSFQSDGVGYSCYQTYEAAVLNAEARSEYNATSRCGMCPPLRMSDWRVTAKGCSVTVSAEFRCSDAPGVARSFLTGFALDGFDADYRGAGLKTQDLACEAVGNTKNHSISFRIVGNKFTFDDRGTGDFSFLISFCGDVTAGNQNELLLGTVRSSATDTECTPVSSQPQSGSGIFLMNQNSTEGDLKWIAGPRYSEIHFKCGNLIPRKF